MNGDALYARLPIPLQNVACTWAGWQRARARFTPHFHDCLARWSQSGWSSQETLLRIQQERLIALPNVKDLRTSFSLGEVKASSRLPLGHLGARAGAARSGAAPARGTTRRR